MISNHYSDLLNYLNFIVPLLYRILFLSRTATRRGYLLSPRNSDWRQNRRWVRHVASARIWCSSRWRPEPTAQNRQHRTRTPVQSRKAWSTIRSITNRLLDLTLCFASPAHYSPPEHLLLEHLPLGHPLTVRTVWPWNKGKLDLFKYIFYSFLQNSRLFSMRTVETSKL